MSSVFYASPSHGREGLGCLCIHIHSPSCLGTGQSLLADKPRLGSVARDPVLPVKGRVGPMCERLHWRVHQLPLPLLFVFFTEAHSQRWDLEEGLECLQYSVTCQSTLEYFISLPTTLLHNGGDQMVPGCQGTMEPMPTSTMLLPPGMTLHLLSSGVKEE